MAIDDDDEDASDEALDPIEELLNAVIESGKPPLAWVVRWSADGREPIRAAWDSAFNPEAMVQLLERHGTLRQVRDARRAARRIDGKPVAPGWRNPAAAARIRAAVPAPPTLDAVVARSEVDERPFDSPAGELVHALDARGAPDPDWLGEWSRDGEDPVRAAWQASQDAVPMAQLILLVRPRVTFDLILQFATVYEGAMRGQLPATLFGPEARAGLVEDAWRAVLALRWTPRRELPAALRALRAMYDAAPMGRYRVEYPLLSALSLVVDPPPDLAELEAALRAAR